MMPAARPHVAATLVFAASVVLVLAEAPLWCTVVALGCATWRIAVSAGWLRAPRARAGMRYVFAALTILCVLAVILNFRTLNGLAAGTALLVLMGALKLMESRTRRDDGIVIGVALFLLLAAALGNQSLTRLPFYLALLWVACAAMAVIAHPGDALRARAALRLSAKALALAIPLAAACFLLFPRFAGQFWAIKRGAQAATGLSDTMSPGAIGQLAIEYDPVFRVDFTDRPPPREALYFRGPVLNSFDGFTWRRDYRRMYSPAAPEMLGEPVRYHVTLEPTQRRWLFALDTLAERPRRDMFLSHDRQLMAMDEVTVTMSYDAVSFLETRATAPLSAVARRNETRIEGEGNPRARALARQMRAQSRDDADYARRALQWFQAQGLEYTLDPGATSLDSVDTTLFDSKRGFCAHFASAYALLMRAAGVPARVVTGYLGGEWNPAGDYLIVRQADAHAWTEIWLDGRGWTRVDPTTVVAPDRLQFGVYDLLPDSARATTQLLRSAWLSRAALLWDGANQWWQRRIIGFDVRSQLEFLRELGIDAPNWRHLGWGFTAALLLWIAWISLALRRSVARRKPDRIGRAWLDANRKLEKVAPARAADEGPMAYAARIGAARPDLAAAVQDVADRYARLRFGPPAAVPDIAQLEHAVRRLAA
jgi:transglutaminase-like putative cysteine protease